MKVIASVEKYENAGMKFSTVPAFALAESRASDACCLFLVQFPHVEVSEFSSPGKFRASCAFWIQHGLTKHASLTARLHDGDGRRPAGSAREQHGSQSSWVEAVRSPRLQFPRHMVDPYIICSEIGEVCVL